jgi:AcrR family transcriptional regulator
MTRVMDETWTPRQRIVYATAQSVRERGVSATAMRDVVRRAHAPRGSLQHYFPEGKGQLVTEALQWSADYAASSVTGAHQSMAEPTPGGLFAAMVRRWRDEFVRRGYGRGCPLVAATADVAEPDPDLRATIQGGFEVWLAAVRGALRTLGVPASRARSLAVLMVSALEGAIVLARSSHSTRPLDDVVRELRPVLDGAVR